MFFLSILSIQCKIRRDRPSNARRSTDAVDLLVTLVYCLSYISFG